MRVTAAFDDLSSDEAADLGDAFWLADTPSNRKLAEAAWASKQCEPNSAVFKRPATAIGVTEVVSLVSDVDLHHPGWRENFNQRGGSDGRDSNGSRPEWLR